MPQNVNGNFSSNQVSGEATRRERQSVSGFCLFVFVFYLFVLKVFRSCAEVEAKSVK